MLEHVRSDGWYGPVQDFIQPAWTRVAGGCHPNRRTEETVAASGFALSEQRANGTMRRFVAKKKQQP
jgi:hypothetical protein